MLNEKITDKTPMIKILQAVDPAIMPDFGGGDRDMTRMAQTLMQDLFAMQTIYRAAIKEISTKLEILNDEFQSTHQRNPIHNMSSRVKSPKSIVEKLSRKGFPVTAEAARTYLDDIAGVRIICPYIEDIYTVKAMIEARDDIEVTRITDYIEHPKDNGYRSLHLIVRLPVFFSDHKELVRIEIQIRTIAMDFWASLEHQLRYKAIEPGRIPEEVSAELIECADTIAETDRRMQDIHNAYVKD